MKPFHHVYQFKIALKYIKPPIWRRIQVPEDYSFWDLHVAIQDSLGWWDYHLHEFEIRNPTIFVKEEIGIPGDDFDDDDRVAGWEVKIAPYFTMGNPKALYRYDFGDNWEHTVRLEGIEKREEGATYPRCIAGKRACPPEDCHGPGGYGNYLKAMGDPTHPEHQEMLDWRGEFDPEKFDPKEVQFDDPGQRWKVAFTEEDLTPEMRLYDIFQAQQRFL